MTSRFIIRSWARLKSTCAGIANIFCGLLTFRSVTLRANTPLADNSPNTSPEDDSEEEEFVYPGTSAEPESEALHPIATTSEENHATIPGLDIPNVTSSPHLSSTSAVVSTIQETPSPANVPTPITPKSPSHPSPAQLEALQAASAAGDLKLLQNLFKTALQSGELEPFALANDASVRTGQTALHAAAGRGHLNVVKWRKSSILAFGLRLMYLQLLRNVVQCRISKIKRAR